jgi:methionine synthase II (cobalamin-independent)
MIANFHAETVGSLQRSDSLMNARAAHAIGSISDADFKRAEDEAVVAALTLQSDVGLKVVTDGEQRRGSFYEWLTLGVNGVSELPAFPMVMRGLPGHEDVLRTSPVSVTGRLSLTFVEVTE